MESTQEKGRGRRWIDMTINIQALVGSLVGAAIVMAAAWFGIVGRVEALEAKDRLHEERFRGVDAALAQQRQDVKDQLKAIGQNVEKIRDYLLDNAAGQRPDIKRWTR
jgi:hypothetical protein